MSVSDLAVLFNMLMFCWNIISSQLMDGSSFWRWPRRLQIFDVIRWHTLKMSKIVFQHFHLKHSIRSTMSTTISTTKPDRPISDSLLFHFLSQFDCCWCDTVQGRNLVFQLKFVWEKWHHVLWQIINVLKDFYRTILPTVEYIDMKNPDFNSIRMLTLRTILQLYF